MPCILGVDPGGTTGMAIRMPTSEILTFTCSEPEQVYDFIFMNRESLTQIVIEDFNAQEIGRWGLHTVRVVGGVRALAHVFKIPYHKHMPQERYAFQKEAKEFLKGKGTVIHEQDALAHLLSWEYHNGT